MVHQKHPSVTANLVVQLIRSDQGPFFRSNAEAVQNLEPHFSNTNWEEVLALKARLAPKEPEDMELALSSQDGNMGDRTPDDISLNDAPSRRCHLCSMPSSSPSTVCFVPGTNSMPSNASRADDNSSKCTKISALLTRCLKSLSVRFHLLLDTAA